MTGVLEVKNLNKSFDGIVVARGINLSLTAGKVLGLIGPNGAGKTSFFNLISGVVKPDSGAVTLAGVSIDRLKSHERVRHGLSRTWQHIRLFPSLTVLDNLLVGTHDYPGESLLSVLLAHARLKQHDKIARERAADVLGRMGLSQVADALVSDLPYGQQKLIGVARALMGDARCLLLDEPMAGVEGQSYAAMQRVVRDAADCGVAVCVVEHNVGFIQDLCDEGVFMFSGAIMARGSVAELIRDPQLTELYFGH
ncbi:ABC transporter ATP-binding protein [Bradyrhizobium sp. LHD-71]|uniref:ABC transporter ATP-binding protein n=1 Tax=Bradyrhizobium sp. LHD-71 TaxID=3072141 RepID=UPI00280EC0D1|nr:ABC transporter ATP-binding protein [Bradyrhizobium sp. LHD-71]MDQ8727352.1 ABC transporter ATP-binding protein [Bradyrhizobium sp. LHD-71]